MRTKTDKRGIKIDAQFTLIAQLTKKLVGRNSAIHKGIEAIALLIEEVVYREIVISEIHTYTAKNWHLNISTRRSECRIHIGTEVRALHKVGCAHLCGGSCQTANDCNEND